MSNLLDKASIILTPTAYNNGEALCVKPSDGSGDFDFSRNSAATRVNAQGLVENVQILSSNLVQNGDFSEEGVEEVSNGSFSQEGAEQITNGDFENGNTGWANSSINGFSVSNGKLNLLDVAYVKSTLQTNVTTVGKLYKVTYEVSNYVQGSFRLALGGTILPTTTSNGVYTYYATATSATYVVIQAFSGLPTTLSIDNVSVREVAQNWSLGTGWSIGENKAVATDAPDGERLQQNNVFTVGKTYKITYEITELTQGFFKVYVGGTFLTSQFSVGVYTEYKTIPSNSVFYVKSSGTTSGSITNISVKEVGQNWTSEQGIWTFGDGVANGNGASGSAEELSQNLSAGGIVTGDKVKLSFEIKNYVSGSVQVIGITPAPSNFGNGIYEYIGEVTSVNFRMRGSSFNGSITNISVIEITEDTNLPRINYEGFSYQDALGSELVTNGDFSNGNANWSAIRGSIQSVSDEGVFTIGGTELNSLVQSNVFTVGKKYILEFYAKSQTYNTNIFTAYFGVDSVIQEQVVSSEFQKWKYVINPNQTNLQIGLYYNASYENIILDNVSVKEYLGQEVVPDSGCGSWLFEPQSTNLFTYSEDFSQSVWNKTNCTIISNNSISPNGTQNADKLVENNIINSFSNRYSTSVSYTSGLKYTISIFAKSDGRDLMIRSYNGSSDIDTIFDLSNGIILSGSTGEIKDYGNGWYRCSHTITAQSTINTAYSASFVLVNNSSISYQGDGTSGIYIWGAQLEEQSYATSYIPTSGTSVTRNQDVCINGGSLATINSTEGTLYAQIAGLNLFHGYISISDGTSGNSIRIGFVSDTLIKVWVYVGNSQQISQLFTYDTSNINKIAVKYSLTDFKVYINGSNVFSTTSVTFPIGTLNELAFRRGDQYSPFYGKTKALAVWKEALSDSELQSLTTI